MLDGLSMWIDSIMAGKVMIITASFYIVLVVSALILLLSKSLKGAFIGFLCFACILEMNMITSTAMHVGSFDINMSEPVEAMLGIIALLLIFRDWRVDKLLFFVGTLMALFATVAIVSNVLIPYDGLIVPPNVSWDNYFYGTDFKSHASIGNRNWFVLGRVAVFIATAMAASAVLSRKDLPRIVNLVLLSFKIHVAFVAFEMVTKQLFHSAASISIRDLLLPSFDSAFTAIQYRGSLVMLHGLTREPSHLSLAFFLFLILMMLARRSGCTRKNNAGWVVAVVLVLFASSSFSSMAYLCFALIFGFVFMAERKVGTACGKKDLVLTTAPFLILAIGALGMFFVISDGYYAAKFYNVFDNLDNIVRGRYDLIRSDAGMPRIISMFESFGVFLERPLFGIGLGSIAPHSGVIALLAGLGLVGAISWFCFLVRYARVVSGSAGLLLLASLVLSVGLVSSNYGIAYATYWIILCSLTERASSAPSEADGRMVFSFQEDLCLHGGAR